MSIRYTERLAEAGIEASVGSVGASYEFKLVRASGSNGPWDRLKAQNALAEAINGLYKAIGNIPPAEAEENFYAQRNVFDMVA